MLIANIWMFVNSVLSTCEDSSLAWTADEAKTVQVQLQSRFEVRNSVAWFMMVDQIFALLKILLTLNCPL